VYAKHHSEGKTMTYGKDLLTKAVAKIGTRYALAKATGLAESEISRAWNGKRDVPASWVLPLARVAEVDPTEAMESWDLERAEKKRLRQQLLRSAVAGVAAMCAAFGISVEDARAAIRSAPAPSNLISYTSSKVRRTREQLRGLFVRTRWLHLGARPPAPAA
jgi:DNA-binding transcriptional regulator YdaS (Cro superfamily)